MTWTYPLFKPDFSDKVDDPIATALRHAQREFRTVVATNKARKQRLIAIARDRLGYQEYIELRDSLDKNITTLYAKLQKKDSPKNSKKKKQQQKHTDVAASSDGGHNHNGSNCSSSNGNGTGAPLLSSLAPCPASLGLNPDDDLALRLNDQLKQLVETRRQWVDTVGAVFDEKQRENPGCIWGLPTESIYAEVEEEVRAVLLAQAQVLPHSNSTSGPSSLSCPAINAHNDKGKAKEGGGDDMDVG